MSAPWDTGCPADTAVRTTEPATYGVVLAALLAVRVASYLRTRLAA